MGNPKKQQIRTTTTLTKMVQTKLIKKFDEDPNLPFGDIPSKNNPNIIRILFINTNGLDLGIDSHSFNELCSNGKSQQYTILLLAETNSRWTNKRATDKFGNIITKQWKDESVTKLETNFSWHSAYKPSGTAITIDSLIRFRKTKSGEDNHGLGR